MEPKQFIEVLKQDIQQKSILKHPFYQLWNQGKLSLEALQGYAAQYYAVVDNWPRLISAVHANCNDMHLRQALVRNLVEEELGTNAGEKSHSVLWQQFAQSLGLSPHEIEEASLLPETRAAITLFNNNVRNRSFIEGVGALFAYEQQVPQVSLTKMQGLQEFYNITSKDGLEYFYIHSFIDLKHAKLWESIIEKYAVDEKTQAKVRKTLHEALDAQLIFLDGVYREFVSTEKEICAMS
ncbi:CADD family putative folate metabolism protein [Candidatus Woesearchaeota archaeon]|nr:CADD family putative folate metabolism protein [Candidatus Woesearchaeota archaeon]